MGSVILRSNEGDEDGVCWGLSKDGKFSIKSTYNLIKSQLNLPQDAVWNSIWKLKIPPKIKAFVWLVYHGRILTNEERMRRGLTDNPMCHRCIVDTESLLEKIGLSTII